MFHDNPTTKVTG